MPFSTNIIAQFRFIKTLSNQHNNYYIKWYTMNRHHIDRKSGSKRNNVNTLVEYFADVVNDSAL